MADTKMKMRVEPRNSYRSEKEGGAIPHQIYFEFGSFGGFAPLSRDDLDTMIRDLTAVRDGSEPAAEFKFTSEG